MALSSQPEHHMTSKCASRSRRCLDARDESKCATPSTWAQVPSGTESAGNPNKLKTPSMSQNSNGLKETSGRFACSLARNVKVAGGRVDPRVTARSAPILRSSLST